MAGRSSALDLMEKSILAKSVAAVRRLLELGVGPNRTLPCGWHPVALAAARSSRAVLHELLEAGGDPNAPAAGGMKALHAAALRGREDAVGELAAFGARVDDEGRGETPLRLAAMKGHAGTVAALAGAGAGLDAPGVGGWAALHWAVGTGDLDSARRLIEAGANPRQADAGGKDALTLSAASGSAMADLCYAMAGSPEEVAWIASQLGPSQAPLCFAKWEAWQLELAAPAPARAPGAGGREARAAPSDGAGRQDEDKRGSGSGRL